MNINGKIAVLSGSFHITHILLTVWLSLSSVAVFAQSQPTTREVKAMLELPSEKLDLVKLKLAVDKIVDPSISSIETIKKIESMISDIRSSLPPEASSMQKLQAIRKYLYGRGTWNNGQPFEYEFQDPKSTNLRSKTLARYIVTKKGNCVSMPLLFIVIADRMGLDVSASTAPEHILIKFTETESGRTYNVEATCGAGFARDKWYQEQMQITDQAMGSGAYLQKLSRKETAILGS